MKYKLSEKEAHEILYYQWENGLVPINFTEPHTQYLDAVRFTRIFGYFNYKDFEYWLVT